MNRKLSAALASISTVDYEQNDCDIVSEATDLPDEIQSSDDLFISPIKLATEKVGRERDCFRPLR